VATFTDVLDKMVTNSPAVGQWRPGGGDESALPAKATCSINLRKRDEANVPENQKSESARCYSGSGWNLLISLICPKPRWPEFINDIT
jgi:hypothetical protein